MANKTFKATWMGAYRADNATYVGASNPIRTAGSPWYHAYLGFDKASILSAMNSSKTTPSVFLNIYVTNYGSFDLGMHKEGVNKANNGMPFYRYAQQHWMLNTGWNRKDITNIALQGEALSGFKNILNGGYTGPVLYGGQGADQGEAYGVTNNQFHIYIEVVGTWNTAPSKPAITAPTAGQSIDKTFELKGKASSDAEQSASQLKYEWAIKDGSGTWKYLGLGAAGIVNKVVDFSTYVETTQAQVAFRADDGALSSGWTYSSNFTIAHNKPPGAPTNLLPAGGAFQDRTRSIMFVWQHNDADGQSAYDFRWRLQGNELWTESGKIVTANKSRVVAGNTFPLGTIEWQVRTYDQGNLVGPYSATALFTSSDPTDAPTITDPVAGGSVPQSRINVSWTAAAQDEYHIQLVSSNNMILWEDDQVSQARVVEIPYDLENNQNYTVRLQVAETGSVFSNWAENTFTVSFTTPSAPVVELFEWHDEGAIDVRVTNPISGAVGEPTVISNDIYRREYGTDDAYTRIAVDVSNNSVFRDYTPASGVTYEYYVRAWGDNGTFQDSYSNEITINIENTMISIASNPTRFVRMEYNPSRSIKRGKERSMFQFNGRTSPIAEFGVTETKTINLKFDIQDRTTLEVLMDIIDAKETLLYRDARGRKEYVTVDSLSITDKFPNGYSVSFDPDKVYYIEDV